MKYLLGRTLNLFITSLQRIVKFYAYNITCGSSIISKKTLIFIGGIIILMASCKEKYYTYENNLGIKPALLAQIDTPNYTIITWKDSVQNIGILMEGDTMKIEFHFINSGKKALFVLDVRPSCGCTHVDYPRNIILPGQQGVITAIFSTIGQAAGDITKSIIVKTNTANSMRHALIFKGEIKKRLS